MRLSFILLSIFQLFLVTVSVAGQSIHPSHTMGRRTPHPLPTSIDQVTDPELLAALEAHQSRSRRRKIHGMGHEADELPITNAERLRIGLPLKPPKKDPRHIAVPGDSLEAFSDF